MMAQGGNYFYFWADCRPSSLFVSHRLANVPLSDFGKTPCFEITRVSSSSFKVSVVSPSYVRTEYSQSNSMVPDQIVIGEELYGTSGGWAAEASWTRSQ